MQDQSISLCSPGDSLTCSASVVELTAMLLQCQRTAKPQDVAGTILWGTRSLAMVHVGGHRSGIDGGGDQPELLPRGPTLAEERVRSLLGACVRAPPLMQGPAKHSARQKLM